MKSSTCGQAVTGARLRARRRSTSCMRTGTSSATARCPGVKNWLRKRLQTKAVTSCMAARAQAINDLHEDEDFQRDGALPRVRAAVDDTRGRGERLERYADDAAVMGVMAKLRRFQARLRHACARTQAPVHDGKAVSCKGQLSWWIACMRLCKVALP